MVLRLQCDTAPRLVSLLKTVLKHSANTSKVTAIHLPEKGSTFSTTENIMVTKSTQNIHYFKMEYQKQEGWWVINFARVLSPNF